VAQLNIAHYKRLLATETDQAKRELLVRLLKEEEAKLAEAEARHRKRPPSTAS
jgi:hypothetical protein